MSKFDLEPQELFSTSHRSPGKLQSKRRGMEKRRLGVAGLALLMAAGLAAATSPVPASKAESRSRSAQGPERRANIIIRSRASNASIVLPVERLNFYKDTQGFIVANAWGDPAQGAHSNFMRMPGHSASGHHTHTFSYYGVVILGTVVNEPVGSRIDHPLRPGSYWYQSGGEPHVTKCVSAAACLFFVTSPGSFDYLPAP